MMKNIVRLSLALSFVFAGSCAPSMAQSQEALPQLPSWEELQKQPKYDATRADELWKAGQQSEKSGNMDDALDKYSKIVELTTKAKGNTFAGNMNKMLIVCLEGIESKVSKKDSWDKAQKVAEMKLKIIESTEGATSPNYQRSQAMLSTYKRLQGKNP